jgi:hypothetical protein
MASMLFCMSAARAPAADAAARAALAASCTDANALAGPAPRAAPGACISTVGASSCNFGRAARAVPCWPAIPSALARGTADSGPRGREAWTPLPVPGAVQAPGATAAEAARGCSTAGAGPGSAGGAADPTGGTGTGRGAGDAAVGGVGACTASACGKAADARCPGGSAKSVNRREALEAQPAVSLTATTGSSIATVVLTLTAGPPGKASSETYTADRGTGMSPAETSADRHSGAGSDGSSLSATLKSSGRPRTALDCAFPKPHARASSTTATRATADKMDSADRLRGKDPRELGMWGGKTSRTLAW